MRINQSEAFLLKDIASQRNDTEMIRHGGKNVFVSFVLLLERWHSSRCDAQGEPIERAKIIGK